MKWKMECFLTPHCVHIFSNLLPFLTDTLHKDIKKMHCHPSTPTTTWLFASSFVNPIKYSFKSLITWFWVLGVHHCNSQYCTIIVIQTHKCSTAEIHHWIKRSSNNGGLRAQMPSLFSACVSVWRGQWVPMYSQYLVFMETSILLYFQYLKAGGTCETE